MASAATPGSQQDFVVNVGDRVFFESDQTDLTPQAIATLEKQAQWLQQYNRYTFTIEGHADERGTREYNIALGARRAQSVRSYLASRGIDPNRMRTISYGKERPVAVCNDISCWSQNRRAVTVLNAVRDRSHFACATDLISTAPTGAVSFAAVAREGALRASHFWRTPAPHVIAVPVMSESPIIRQAAMFFRLTIDDVRSGADRARAGLCTVCADDRDRSGHARRAA